MSLLRWPSAISKVIELRDERREHILRYHPDLRPFLDRLAQTVANPDQIRKSKDDPQVVLFYKFYGDILGGKYMVVVVKTNEQNFVLTAYFTKNIRTGVPYE